MSKNLPVPEHKRAPVNARWFWYIAPPAALTLLYRTIPPHVRRKWNPRGRSTSHTGLAAILAGGGWMAFLLFALPRALMPDKYDFGW